MMGKMDEEDFDATASGDDEAEARIYQSLKKEFNRKNKKSGGFQAMGLSSAIFRGIKKKGYNVPTPIQRKSIPLIMEGKDVVAMARTGSGKTAAFVIPMLEKLKVHNVSNSPRALILSPTRELALQTYSFVKELARYTDLASTIILGGDRIEDQFEAIHQKPDIVIATPGRLLHILVEMNLKLSFVEYCVFDEADRLFEMGFEEQLKEIIARMPASRQTLMFSATLPKSVVEFARAGLTDPTLIRLDVDNKLNEGLKLSYFTCREVDKTAILLHLLRTTLNPADLTVVFAATKHHVEFLKDIINGVGLNATCIYSALDPAARKINLEKFRRRKCSVLVVTDIAARGVDIPDLDNVINYHFPSKGKLFLHRVGRVARAGRSGRAFSLVAPDEFPYLLDLHLFLGRPVLLATDDTSLHADGICGTFPQSMIDEENDVLKPLLEKSDELQAMIRVCDNGYRKFLETRPVASSESIGRFKSQFRSAKIGIHPLFKSAANDLEAKRMDILQGIRSYKARSTIFEISGTAKSEALKAMKEKRKLHERTIVKKTTAESNKVAPVAAATTNEASGAPEEEDIQETFADVLSSRPFGRITDRKRKPRTEHFIPYAPQDHHMEKGLELQKGFTQEARSAMFDVHTDDTDQMMKDRRKTKWDRKKKKFVGTDDSDPRKKKIRTESGALIPASYKTDLYETWKKLHQVDYQRKVESDDEEPGKPKNLNEVNKVLGAGRMKYRKAQLQPGSKTAKDKNKFKVGKKGRSELKSKDQIAKAREKRSAQMAHQKRRHEVNEKNRAAAQKRKK